MQLHCDSGLLEPDCNPYHTCLVLGIGKIGREKAEKAAPKMCPFTQVGYACGHCRYTVREWCSKFETTGEKCPLRVVVIEKR